MPVLNKVAAVTGAGSGIGRSAAAALASAGFAVALIGRRAEPLLETQGAIATAGGKAHVVQADVADAVSVEHAFSQIAETFGRLDVLFNNAGRNAGAVPLEDYDVNF